jgi:phasin family protein
MAQDDLKNIPTSGIEAATTSFSILSKNVQTLSAEIATMSKQSFEHASQTVEKLRNAHTLEEVFAIQANYVKEAFEQATARARRFSEIISAVPVEVSKQYQDVVLKSVNAAVQSAEAASKNAATNVEQFSNAIHNKA